MEKNNTSSLNDLVVTYGVAVVSIVIALGLGAYTVAGAIAMFAGSSASLPSIFGLLGSGGITSLVTTGAIATFGGGIAHMAMKKVATSKDAGQLVNSDSYAIINKTARAFCFLVAGAALVGAVAVLLGALLSINDYTPWKSYLLGEVLPLIFVAVGFGAAAVVLDKFVRATIKPSVLTTIALAIAIAGIALACIAVIVKSHVKSTPSSTLDSIYNTIRSYDEY